MFNSPELNLSEEEIERELNETGGELLIFESMLPDGISIGETLDKLGVGSIYEGFLRIDQNPYITCIGSCRRLEKEALSGNPDINEFFRFKSILYCNHLYPPERFDIDRIATQCNAGIRFYQTASAIQYPKIRYGMGSLFNMQAKRDALIKKEKTGTLTLSEKKEKTFLDTYLQGGGWQVISAIRPGLILNFVDNAALRKKFFNAFPEVDEMKYFADELENITTFLVVTQDGERIRIPKTDADYTPADHVMIYYLNKMLKEKKYD